MGESTTCSPSSTLRSFERKHHMRESTMCSPSSTLRSFESKIYTYESTMCSSSSTLRALASKSYTRESAMSFVEDATAPFNVGRCRELHPESTIIMTTAHVASRTPCVRMFAAQPVRPSSVLLTTACLGRGPTGTRSSPAGSCE
jgi:hypothetical protein